MWRDRYKQTNKHQCVTGNILWRRRRLTDEWDEAEQLWAVMGLAHIHLLVFPFFSSSSSFFFFFLPLFYFALHPPPLLLPMLNKALCCDSALYLYFKWLNYKGSRGENYGCFPLFFPTGTRWPLPGSNNQPPPPTRTPPTPLLRTSLHLSYSSSLLPFFLINVCFAARICG